MATNVLSINSNATGLRIAEEATIGVLPGTPTWLPYQPTGYGDTGSEVETVADEPINPDRMDEKGTPIRKTVVASFQTSYRRVEQWRLLQGFFFADFIEKPGNFGQLDAETVDATVTVDQYSDTGIDVGWAVGNIVLAENFLNSENNGISVVTATASGTITVDKSLVTETGSAGETGGENGTHIWNVGIEGVADDLEIDASGARPILRSAAGIDWTALGLTVGEYISIGGDTAGAAGNQFITAANNTEARIFSISTLDLVLDVAGQTMVTENPTGTETIQVFWAPRILKNRTASNIVRRTYQAEQQLGDPDTTQPTWDPQAAYNKGLVPNEAVWTINTAAKLEAEYGFVGTQDELIDAAASSLKTGNRPTTQGEDIYNTSSNFKTIKLFKYNAADANPSALLVYGTEWTITINNGATALEAAGVFGAFDVTTGNFKVSATVTGYFIDFEAKKAVNGACDVSLLAHAFQTATQSGVTWDIPLITLGDGKVQIEKDEAVKIPLTMTAARAKKLSSNHDYVMMMMFWAYLPVRALPTGSAC